MTLTVGVLALQGGFYEHINLLRKASRQLGPRGQDTKLIEVRNSTELSTCDALVIPGGESTTMALVAAQSGLLEPLRKFVKVDKKPVWGTCAGLILLAEAANDTKKGGQELVGGLAVRVHRNHFGRQVESFITDLSLPFLASSPGQNGSGTPAPYSGVFIRAPIVEALLTSEGSPDSPERSPVEIMGVLPGRRTKATAASTTAPDTKPGEVPKDLGDVIAVRQDNVFGTSFHPELTDDTRIHVWWLDQVVERVGGQWR
ncbi:putative pyridoxal 5'-phosphate synthase subunit PDX2 [Zalerion maritima]|uniref:glutaminase n=1 Tax=Zalerion maritima TaxID=339359 RepID=A0AAD5WV92_9PEZI|nr:putative pyridoxal 5'-phosphate synthase subunit PDX2 [Zalerion maritima]